MDKKLKSNSLDIVFEIGQLVKIKDLNIKGRISGIYIGPQRITYDVRYFWEGTPKELYFRQSEIEEVAEVDEIKGFK